MSRRPGAGFARVRGRRCAHGASRAALSPRWAAPCPEMSPPNVAMSLMAEDRITEYFWSVGQEDRLDARVEGPVHQGQLELVVEVREGAHAAHDDVHADAVREVDDEPVPGGHGDVRAVPWASSVIMASLSSASKSEAFDGFTAITTCTASNRREARRRMFRWPFVGGSIGPGRSTLNMDPRIAELPRVGKGKIFDKAHAGRIELYGNGGCAEDRSACSCAPPCFAASCVSPPAQPREPANPTPRTGDAGRAAGAGRTDGHDARRRRGVRRHPRSCTGGPSARSRRSSPPSRDHRGGDYDGWLCYLTEEYVASTEQRRRSSRTPPRRRC